MTAPAPLLPRRSFIATALAALAGMTGFARVRRAEAAPAGSGQPYVGEIILFAGDFAPVGWFSCDGQLLPISEYDTLFSLIGTTYGGDGQTTFALPDLRGRAPMHSGNGFILGQPGGSETVALTAGQIPSHSHAAAASTSPGDSADPSGRVPAVHAAGVPLYGAAADTNLAAASLLSTGGSQTHNNMQPSIGIQFIISAYGVYPSPS